MGRGNVPAAARMKGLTSEVCTFVSKLQLHRTGIKHYHMGIGTVVVLRIYHRSLLFSLVPLQTGRVSRTWLLVPCSALHKNGTQNTWTSMRRNESCCRIGTRNFSLFLNSFNFLFLFILEWLNMSLNK